MIYSVLLFKNGTVTEFFKLAARSVDEVAEYLFLNPLNSDLFAGYETQEGNRYYSFPNLPPQFDVMKFRIPADIHQMHFEDYIASRYDIQDFTMCVKSGKGPFCLKIVATDSAEYEKICSQYEFEKIGPIGY